MTLTISSGLQKGLLLINIQKAIISTIVIIKIFIFFSLLITESSCSHKTNINNFFNIYFYDKRQLRLLFAQSLKHNFTYFINTRIFNRVLHLYTGTNIIIRTIRKTSQKIILNFLNEKYIIFNLWPPVLFAVCVFVAHKI